MDFREQIQHIERLLEKKEYTDAATRCVIIIEQALRQVFSRYLEQVDDIVKDKVEEAVRKRGGKIAKLTMGQVVHIFRESGFLEAWAQVSGKDLSSLQVIDLQKLTQLRNKFMHNAQEAASTEAEFLLHCVKIILKSFDITNPEGADVFLSFNREDRDVVERVACYLKDNENLHPWFDAWELIPGESWTQTLERGLEDSATCAVFVGKSGEGPWQKREVEVALRQQVQNPGFRVIPVLLPGTPKRPKLPAFLAANTWVDLRKGLNDTEALRLLVCGIRGVAPGESAGGKLSRLPESPGPAEERTEKNSDTTAAGKEHTEPPKPASAQYINIGGNAGGNVFVSGNRNITSMQYQQTSLPSQESADIRFEFAAIRRILEELPSPDARKIDRALCDAEDELDQPAPDKAEIGQALERALNYARKFEDFARVKGRLQPHLARTVSWLGSEWQKIL